MWRKATHVSRFGSLLALTLLTNLGVAASGVVSGIFLARLLGPEGRGQLAAIQSWPMFLSVFAHLGIHDALAYYSARYPHESGRWMTTGVLIALWPNLMVMAAGYYLMPVLLAAQPEAVVEAARNYLWYIPVALATGLPAYALRGRNDLVAWNLSRALPSAIWLTVVLASLILLSPAPTAIARIYVVALAATAIPFTTFLVWRRLPHSFRPSLKMAGPMAVYGLPSVLSSVPSTLNLRLDQMLIAALVGPQVLGLYVVGTAWSVAGSLVMNSLAGAVLPRVAGISDPAQQALALAQAARLGVVLSALMALATMAATPVAVPLLFGAEFAAAIPATLILAPAAAVAAFNQLLTTGAMSLGQPRLVLIAESAGLVATAALLWLLLARFQLMGAAWASLLSYLVTSGVLLGLIVGQTGLRLRELLLPARADALFFAEKLRAARLTAKAA